MEEEGKRKQPFLLPFHTHTQLPATVACSQHTTKPFKTMSSFMLIVKQCPLPLPVLDPSMGRLSDPSIINGDLLVVQYVDV